ncbi:MAG: MlaE family ABC transporter permease [Thermodesulfobacteriota bacterium]
MEPISLNFSRKESDTLLIILAGDWKRENRPPAASEVEKQLEMGSQLKHILFKTENLVGWDSMLLTFVIRVRTLASRYNMTVEEDNLPEGVQRLLALASAVPERRWGKKEPARIPTLEWFGESALVFWRSLLDMTDFIGNAFIAFIRLFTGKAEFRLSDLLLIIQQCGAQALPIVSLISILVGLILAFIGAIQLKVFGAQIYVASIVGIGMVRFLAPVMAAIIMAGRTGASFAAQLGTMQVNEEIDALKTLGISPMEFLVLPRMLALFLMMPLLSLYADLMGILGGMIIGVSMLDLNFLVYYAKTRESVHLNDFWVGLFSAAVFGVLVALSGCMRGMQCGRSAAAVGEATTSAVVTSIVSIVVAMALITVVCQVLNI